MPSTARASRTVGSAPGYLVEAEAYRPTSGKQDRSGLNGALLVCVTRRVFRVFGTIWRILGSCGGGRAGIALD